MGIYATMSGREVKFSGIFAQAINEIGIDTTDSVVVVPRDRAEHLLFHFAHLLENAKLINGGLDYQTIAGFANDAHKLCELFDWYRLSDDDELVFV